MQVVWFKRDLRIHDHQALVGAIKAQASMGPVLPLYIFEPELWQQPDLSHRHYLFLYECLASLHRELSFIGCPLVVKVGNAVEVLADLHNKYTITALWSHQETWNGWTFQRDLTIKSWTRQQQIIWYEPLQYGVFRRIDKMHGRDGWASMWHDVINREVLPAPNNIYSASVQQINEISDVLPTPQDLKLVDEFLINPNLRQLGGRDHAMQTLNSFLIQRGEGYTKQMSSPVTAYNSCSRLSPYLAFGVLSMREVFNAYKTKKNQIEDTPKHLRGKWGSAMKSFSARLRWHCHFMQKLETEPAIEFKNLHPVYDGMREHDFNEAYFKAWETGYTGYPMVDACMRALIATGWINFRMRAMLMSFASHHLWLHWRRTSLHLARLFVDYEPGIHYSQAQMQSGTTGINSIRVYNPIKQGIDQDPNGEFIKRWIPELKGVPKEFIHTPWQCAYDLILGAELMNGYPMPIVDEKTARKKATDKLAGIRKHREHGNIAKQIVNKHASRKLKIKTNLVTKNNKINEQFKLNF